MNRQSEASAFARRAGRAVVAAVAVAIGLVHVDAQIPGRNVNMVSGTARVDGDPYLQRQNEPSIAASTRNPLHLLAGANDYRTVDIPGLPDDEETGDAWLGMFRSTDGGQRWTSTLLPGYAQDETPAGLASPLRGYAAGADPVVRAGTNGLFYYAGLVFDRGDHARSAIFVSRFIDNNDTENGNPIAAIGTTIVASGTGATGRFLDKPWMAVDIPRGTGPTCRVGGTGGRPAQQVPAGPVYVTWSAITGTYPDLRSDILLSRSIDCGATWSTPVVISRRQDQINQGSTIAIDPRTGTVYVAWRRFATAGDDTDAIAVARSSDFGRKFDPPGTARRFPKGKKKGLLPAWAFEHRRFKPAREVAEVAPFDQGSATDRFRTNGYPTMAVDDTGRVYVAWTERGFSTLRPDPADGDAKIVMSTSPNGRDWTPPRAATEVSAPGHQFMPSLTFAGRRLLLVYYDLREDASQVFSRFADESSRSAAQVPRIRTMDIRASLGTPGAAPAFAPSTKVSDYLVGSDQAVGAPRQLQFNPPNLPLFRQGTTPFVGDYIDITPSPAFVPDGRGGWRYNTTGGTTLPVFHATWTDNRDVRPPRDGNWSHYTPPLSTAYTGVCDPGFTASRNQNVYTARITGGLIVGSPGNSKPLSPTLQRAFVVFAQNTTTVTRTFRLSIAEQPAGGRASFSQFQEPGIAYPLTAIDVTTPPRSLAARSVYVTSSNPDAQVQVNVAEVASVGGAPLADGLQGQVILNPDILNPDILNPDILNPDILNPDILNAEVYNPDILNPDILNPDILNPDILNPDILNPDILNPDILNGVVANPDILNPDILNGGLATPDILNPDILNPDILNPDILNPDILNGALTDVSWTMTNTGNTTTAYNVNLFLTQQTVPAGFKFQLVLHKTYRTPVAIGCELKNQTHNVLVANIKDPVFVDASTTHLVDQNDPSATNPTLWLAPGESGRITLRIIDPDRSNNVTVNGVSVDPAFTPTAAIAPMVVAQPVGTPEIEEGITEPTVETPGGSTILFLQQPTDTATNVAVAPTVRVQVRDTHGAVLPGVAVQLALGANPSGADALALAATTDAIGVATFAGVTVSRSGVGYTLVASASTPGLTLAPATSQPFTVSGAATYVVTNTSDGGPGSLRAALANANGNAPYTDTVAFAIPGAAPFTIAPSTPLPVVTDPILIDGTSQPGYMGAPVVALSGAVMPSDSVGVRLAAPGSTVRGLSIHSFATTTFSGGHALVLASDDNTVAGNYLGLDPLGLVPARSYTGVQVFTSDNVIGGATAAERNVISGTAQGVWFAGAGTGNRVQGNFIGTTPAGDAAAVVGDENPANQFGVLIDAGSASVIGGTSAGQGNVISGNDVGVQFRGGAMYRVEGNAIGTDAAGVSAVPNDAGILADGGASGHVIGGAAAGARNLISGNHGAGISLQGASGFQVLGNYVGAAFDGQPLGNGTTGVEILGAASTILGTPAAGNVIAANGAHGVRVAGVAAVIQGNAIGTDPTGGLDRGNGGAGVLVENGTGTTIGGASAAGNLIAHNATGVLVSDATGVAITSNRIVANDGLGIDLAGDGVTANDASDADGGGNGRQNYPELTGASNIVGQTRVDFAFSSTAGPTYTLEFFAGATCDASGYGEGAMPLATAHVASGASGAMLLPQQAPGTVITATATDPAGNTSEFSNCVTVASVSGSIASATPSPLAAGPGQTVTIAGSGLQAAGAGDVIVRQGLSTYPAAHVWSVGPTQVVARLPNTLLPGPADVRVTSPGGAVTTDWYGLVIATTPGTPAIERVMNGTCGGYNPTPLTAIGSSQVVTVAAPGIDGTGAEFVWTPSGGEAVVTAAGAACTGPTGLVAVTTTAPDVPSDSTVTLQVRTSVNGVPSALSAGVILSTPPPPIPDPTGPLTIVGPLGGNGGNVQPDVDCAFGSAGVGLKGRAGDDIDRVDLWCAPVSGGALGAASYAGTLGTSGGGSDFGVQLICPATYVMTGIRARVGGGAGTVLDVIGTVCRRGASVYTSPLVGLAQGAGAIQTLACPAGTSVTGLQGRSGAVIDQMSLKCR